MSASDNSMDLDNIFDQAEPVQDYQPAPEAPVEVPRPRFGPTQKGRRAADGRPYVKKNVIRKQRVDYSNRKKRNMGKEWERRSSEDPSLSKRAFYGGKQIAPCTLERSISIARMPLPKHKDKFLDIRCNGVGRIPKIMVEADRDVPGHPTMHDTLYAYVKEMRGPRPSKEREPVKKELEDEHGKRLYIRYVNLIDRLQEVHEKKFHESVLNLENLEDTWYKRVLRWCIAVGISIRKASATTVESSQVERVAAEVDSLLDEVRDVVEAGNLKPSEIANLDETSCRILVDEIAKTLAWKGQREVLKEDNAESKLYLSIIVVWFADGSFDFIVCWTTNRKGENALDDVDRWQEINGVTWFEAYSKWSNLEHYHRMLRYFFGLGRPVKLFIDDMARGHNGPAPDYFMGSVGAKRLRIPGSSTWAVQAADQGQANGTFKPLIRNEMRRFKLRLACLKEKKKSGLPKSLTMNLKKIVSNVLDSVRTDMGRPKKPKEKRSRKQGIAMAFKQTLLCRCQGNQPTRRLQELLQHAKPFEKKVDHEYACRCGHSWATKCPEYKNHHKICYLNRRDLLPPLFDLSPDLKVRAEQLNARWTPGIVAMTANGNYFLGKPNVSYKMCDQKMVVTDEEWWNEAPELTYRRAEPPELACAYQHGLL